MIARTAALAGVVAVIVLSAAPLAGQAPAGYKAPRTPWGDPDLQGTWPATDMVGTPLQRAASFGSRNVLTEEEFKARQAAAAQQNDEDNAEFKVGGPVSPPPHWLERGTPSYQAALVVDPPDGRLPPHLPDA